MDKTISILTPTRRRAGQFFGMAASARATADRPELLRIVGYVDDDDPEKGTYRLSSDARVRVGPSEGVAAAWNVLAAEDDSDLLFLGNDDLVFETAGWDRRFREEAAKFPDGIFCLYANDGINAERHAAFPMVSRAWVRALGRFTGATAKNGFRFFYNDTWLFDIGHRVGRNVFIPDVMIRHRHWTTTGAADETTTRNRSGGQGENDRRAWIATSDLREADAVKLRAVMSGPVASSGSVAVKDRIEAR